MACGTDDMAKNAMRPVPPGEVLREDFLLPLGMSANRLAQALRVTMKNSLGWAATTRVSPAAQRRATGWGDRPIAGGRPIAPPGVAFPGVAFPGS